MNSYEILDALFNTRLGREHNGQTYKSLLSDLTHDDKSKISDAVNCMSQAELLALILNLIESNK